MICSMPRSNRLDRGTAQERDRADGPREAQYLERHAQTPISIYLLQLVQIHRTVLAREGQPLILLHLLGDAADMVVSRVVCREFSILLDE